MHPLRTFPPLTEPGNLLDNPVLVLLLPPSVGSCFPRILDRSLLRADCSVCSDGYSEQLGFVCSKCPETNTGGIAIAVVLAVGVLIAAAAMISYVTSGEDGMGAGCGCTERVTRYIPLQSVKIVIATWQILTQV